jgi:hypothetical protein
MMPSKYWIKLYHEILDDPKMGRLPDALWRRTIELFLLAGDLDADGVLPAVDDMAWRLRVDPAALATDLKALANVGIVTSCDDGCWIVTKFADRQAAATSSERGARFRERQRKQEYYEDRAESEQDTNDAFVDTDTETEEDTDQRDADAGAAEPEPEPPPTTFQGWHELVTTSTNPNAALRFMHQVLFPGRKLPEYGYIGRAAHSVGGPGRLADLMWQAVPRAPTGDILRYCLGMARGQREGDKPAEPASFPGIRAFQERMKQRGNDRRDLGDPAILGSDLPPDPDDRVHGGGIRDGPD